jgi:hypothetical protein
MCFAYIGGGFQNAISFYYSAPAVNPVINIWTGDNADGFMLKSVTLPSTPSDINTYGVDYCPFEVASITFDGVAQSVEFGGKTSDSFYRTHEFTCKMVIAIICFKTNSSTVHYTTHYTTCTHYITY